MATFRNTVLRHLGPVVVARLNLSPVVFGMLHEMECPGALLEHLFFVENGVASMTTTFMDGAQVEVSLFGYESIIGVSALMGTKRSLNRVYTQIAGSGFSSPVETARAEFRRGEQFHELSLRYVQAQLLQAMQSAGCNAKHSVEQRLARWLLICADRTNMLDLKLSQELLADMLGTARPTVTLAAAILRGENLIAYTRGSVRILDFPGLERRSCECYRVIKQHLDNYAEFDTDYVS